METVHVNLSEVYTHGKVCCGKDASKLTVAGVVHIRSVKYLIARQHWRGALCPDCVRHPKVAMEILGTQYGTV